LDHGVPSSWHDGIPIVSVVQEGRSLGRALFSDVTLSAMMTNACEVTPSVRSHHHHHHHSLCTQPSGQTADGCSCVVGLLAVGAYARLQNSDVRILCDGWCAIGVSAVQGAMIDVVGGSVDLVSGPVASVKDVVAFSATGRTTTVGQRGATLVTLVALTESQPPLPGRESTGWRGSARRRHARSPETAASQSDAGFDNSVAQEETVDGVSDVTRSATSRYPFSSGGWLHGDAHSPSETEEGDDVRTDAFGRVRIAQAIEGGLVWCADAVCGLCPLLENEGAVRIVGSESRVLLYNTTSHPLTRVAVFDFSTPSASTTTTTAALSTADAPSSATENASDHHTVRQRHPLDYRRNHHRSNRRHRPRRHHETGGSKE